MEYGQQPDFIDFDQIDWRSRNENTNLIIELKPSVLSLMIYPNAFEINQLQLEKDEKMRKRRESIESKQKCLQFYKFLDYSPIPDW